MYHSINPPLYFFSTWVEFDMWIMSLIGSLLRSTLKVNISSILGQSSLHFYLSTCLLSHLLRNTYYSFIQTSIFFHLNVKITIIDAHTFNGQWPNSQISSRHIKIWKCCRTTNVERLQWYNGSPRLLQIFSSSLVYIKWTTIYSSLHWKRSVDLTKW